MLCGSRRQSVGVDKRRWHRLHRAVLLISVEKQKKRSGWRTARIRSSASPIYFLWRYLLPSSLLTSKRLLKMFFTVTYGANKKRTFNTGVRCSQLMAHIWDTCSSDMEKWIRVRKRWLEDTLRVRSLHSSIFFALWRAQEPPYIFAILTIDRNFVELSVRSNKSKARGMLHQRRARILARASSGTLMIWIHWFQSAKKVWRI